MWSTWLLPLTLLSSGRIPVEKVELQQKSANGTRELPDVDISIEEILLLNRHFVDYLVAVDDQTIEGSSDRQCAIALRQLAAAYLERQQVGLECECDVNP